MRTNHREQELLAAALGALEILRRLPAETHSFGAHLGEELIVRARLKKAVRAYKPDTAKATEEW